MFLNKKMILILSIIILCAGVVFGNQNFPKVGVININKIAQTYFKTSKSLRDLEQEKEQNKRYIDQIKEDIKELEKKILEAKINNDYDTARRYELEKDKKTEHLREYTRITTQRMEEKLKKLYYSDNFMNELLDAIDTISFKNGFSLVLDVDAGNIYFYTPEIDITNLVIEELMKNK
jgi:outer membrane protein